MSICCVCFTKCEEESIEVFSELGKQQNIAIIISKYFWFEILQPGRSSSSPIICKICWLSIDTFHKFYIGIETIHHQNNVPGHFLLIPPIDEIDSVPDLEHDYADNLLQNNEIYVKVKNEINLRNELKNIACDDEETQYDDHALNNTRNNQIDPIVEVSKTDVYHLKTKLDRHKRKKLNKKNEKLNKLSLADNSLVHKNEKLEKRNVNIEKSIQEANEIRQYFEMKCELCNTALDSLSDAHQHYRKTHNIKGYLKCCGRKFVQRCRVLDHIAYHLNPDLHKCTVCNKSYLSQRSLSNHIEIHLPIESKQYKCHLCTQSYAKKCNLTHHIRIGHRYKPEKSFTCDICNKWSYSTKGILASHIFSIHLLQSISHVCDICAKMFKSRRALDDHRSREHLNIVEPRAQCNICGSWLKNYDGLRKHMIRHKNGPQTCSHCGKIKPNKEALRDHIRNVHQTVTEWHTCSICNKSFKRAIILKEHMASHTGDALYNCPHCPKTFNSSANMHSHRKKIHPIEWQTARLKRLLK